MNESKEDCTVQQHVPTAACLTSTPIVDLESRLNSFLVNRDSKLDFPTPLSPINTTAQMEGIQKFRLLPDGQGSQPLTHVPLAAPPRTLIEVIIVILVSRHCVALFGMLGTGSEDAGD